MPKPFYKIAGQFQRNHRSGTFTSLNIRDAQEHPETMEEVSGMTVGLNEEEILQGLAILETQKRVDFRTLSMLEDYSTQNVSDKVVRIMLSYIDYINRQV